MNQVIPFCTNFITIYFNGGLQIAKNWTNKYRQMS